VRAWLKVVVRIMPSLFIVKILRYCRMPDTVMALDPIAQITFYATYDYSWHVFTLA
jgi:hypothetical protein